MRAASNDLPPIPEGKSPLGSYQTVGTFYTSVLQVASGCNRMGRVRAGMRSRRRQIHESVISVSIWRTSRTDRQG